MPRKTNCFRKNLEKGPPCGIRHKSYLWPALLLRPLFYAGLLSQAAGGRGSFSGHSIFRMKKRLSQGTKKGEATPLF